MLEEIEVPKVEDPLKKASLSPQEENEDKMEFQETTLQEKQNSEEDQVWTLRLDGSKSKQGLGVRFKLVSPSRKIYMAAHRLQFSCTNNVVEYESLVHGLLHDIQKEAKILHALGNS